MLNSVPAYPEYITELAALYGYKTANLYFFNSRIRPLLPAELQAKVPEQDCWGISHQEIAEHLHAYTSWRQQWESFVSLYRQQDEHDKLSDEAKATLESLRSSIIACFNAHPLTIEAIKRFAPDERQAVRSTGKNEDSISFANPGGNESVNFVLPNEVDISEAIGRVVASYFSEKSLLQRLKAGIDITQDPFIPVLIHKSIDETRDSTVCSGVIYSGAGCTRLQVAPGHGELVVNSKGNCDSFYVTGDNIVYAEPMIKEYKIAPVLNPLTNKVELKKLQNSKLLQTQVSIEHKTVLELHAITQFIERQYGFRVDIEFVYEHNKDLIHIVQVRPIPPGQRQHMIPSSIHPSKIAQLKAQAEIIQGKPLTLEVTRAVVITKASEVIICPTVEDALSQFLSPQPGNEKPKAIIVQQEAPDTSHEVGEFSSHAIPTIQVDNLEAVERWLEGLDDNQSMIVDPQRKSLFKLSMPGDQAQAFLEEGVFRSTLSGRVLPINYQFGAPDQASGEFSEDMLLGDLIHQSQQNVPGASMKLFSFLYSIIKTDQREKQEFSYAGLLLNVEKCHDVQFGQPNEEIRSALGQILSDITLMSKKGLIKPNLFKQIMITGGELWLHLNRAQGGHYSDQNLMVYLNIVEKLSGLMTAVGNKNALTDSLSQNLSEIKAQKIARLEGQGNTAHFTQWMKMRKLFLRDEGRRDWTEFCQAISLDPEATEILSKIIYNVVNSGIDATWINLSFLSAYTRGGRDPHFTLRILVNEYNEVFEETKTLGAVHSILANMEKQIPLWRDPKVFDEKFAELKTDMLNLKEVLVYRPEDTELKQQLMIKYLYTLVDNLDKTLKSLERSNLYSDKLLQVKRFYQMLDIPLSLMESLAPTAGFSENQYDYIRRFYNIKAHMNLSSNDFSPTRSFCLIAAIMKEIIGGSGSINVGTLSYGHSLEDYFMLIHQNLLMILGVFFKRAGFSEEKYPEKLKFFVRRLGLAIAKRCPVRMQLVCSELVYPEIKLYFNVPLRNHSARIAINYNYTTGKARVKSSFIGDSEGRWERMELESYYLCALYNLNFIKPPHVDVLKDMIDFEVEISEQSEFENMTKVLAECSFMTYRDGGYKYCYTNVTNRIRMPSVERSQEMVRYFEKKADRMEKYSIQRDILSDALIYLRYCASRNSPDFNMTQYLIESYRSPTQYATLLGSHFQYQYSLKKIDLNFRRNQNEYSVLELFSKHFHPLDFEFDFALLPKIDWPSQNYFISTKFHQCLASRYGCETLTKVREIFQKGAPFKVRESSDDFCPANEDEVEERLDLFREFPIERESLDFVLFSNIFPEFSYKQKTSFQDKLATMYGVDLTSRDFKIRMLAIAKKENHKQVVAQLERELKDFAMDIEEEPVNADTAKVPEGKRKRAPEGSLVEGMVADGPALVARSAAQESDDDLAEPVVTAYGHQTKRSNPGSQAQEPGACIQEPTKKQKRSP